MKKLVLSILFSIPLLLLAQNGTIRGTVIEDETGQTVIGANVAILDPLTGTSTDLDGKFSISIAPGTYDMKISFISFQNFIVEDVVVKPGEVNNIGSIRMKSSSLNLDEVVVTATATRKSEAALNTMKKKSATMMDGISAQKMAMTGDGTAIEAAQRVTGVSIEGGKYIYVRGLGDRYSKVTLNGMDLPGLDPDKNSLQMDIFPTSLIDNIVVSKTFSAHQQANFTGGLVNIETKAFPDERVFDVSFGLGINPSMHFNSDYLTYEGGGMDWFGMDDGTRDLPSNTRLREPIRPFLADDSEVRDFTKSFNPQMAAIRETSFMDFSLGATYGDQIELNKNKEDKKRNPKLGYIFSLNYKYSQKYFDDVKYGEYQLTQDPDEKEMVFVDKVEGEMGQRTSLVGALAGLAYKTKLSKYKLSVLRLQSAESKAGIFDLENNGAGGTGSGFIGQSNNLEFNERSVTNAILNGTHVVKKPNLEIEWKFSPTLSNADDPDIRQTPFTFTPTDTLFNPGGAGVPTRIWRYLDEYNLASRVDITKSFKLFDRDAALKAGLSHTYKDREYEIMMFTMDFWDGSQNWPSADPNLIYEDRYLYPSNDNEGYMVPGNDIQFSRITNPNAYQAQSENFAGYFSAEFSPMVGLKAVLGVRVEDFTLTHSGRDQVAGNRIAQAIKNGATDQQVDDLINQIKESNGELGNVLEDDDVLDATDFFPSVNLIYSLNEFQNLRFSFSRTIARPSFKELSYAQILDPITGRTFNGSLFPIDTWEGNLVETRINNFDFRWEKFLERGQIFSASVFYKSFDNPIESVRLPTAPGFQYQSRNVGDAELMGFEVEATKSLDFLSSKLDKFSVSGNFTYVYSEVDMTELEFQARKNFEKNGENIDDRRAMAGQAPYVVNFGISYNDYEKGISGGLFYNVKGPTLILVGNGQNPDVYQQPFHSLNIGASKKFGEEKNTMIDLKVENLLSDVRESFYTSYEAEDQIFSQFTPGVLISLGFSHSF